MHNIMDFGRTTAQTLKYSATNEQETETYFGLPELRKDLSILATERLRFDCEHKVDFYKASFRITDSAVVIGLANMAFQDNKNTVSSEVQGAGGQLDCTFCRKAVDASSSCSVLEKATLRNLYMSLQIYEDAADLERLTQLQLPLCTRCRDKVVILSCNWQTYMFAKRNFENVRNDLAFATIDSHNRNRNGAVSSPSPSLPMDRIREKICEKWTGAYCQQEQEHKQDRMEVPK